MAAQEREANATTPAVRPRRSTTDDQQDYLIGPGDVLEIRVFNKPQLSRDGVRVSGRGTITMPLLESDVVAACKTEKQLAREIAQLYLEYLRDPEVYVAVKEFRSKPAAVIGAVRSPGQFQLQRPARLLELLALSGGQADNAGDTIQIVHGDDQPPCANATPDDPAPAKTDPAVAKSDPAPDYDADVTYYSLTETLRGESQSNPYVRPGDVISVLAAEEAYVVGNVLRPMSVPLKQEVTVTQAIAMAGGLMPDTRTEKVRIIRRVAGQTGKTEIFVDLKAVEKRQAEDVALRANDIVDVPTSGGKRFLRALLGTVAPTVGQLPVRVIR